MELENIKFRAKVLNSGEWVVGDLLHRITDTCIAVKDMDDIVYYPVDPATVCQFTGLKDENGVELYEGDYIQIFDEVRLIEYNPVACSFILQETPIRPIIALDILEHYAFEIVGNIFDKEK